MVKVTFFQNREGKLIGFDSIDHAEFSENNDIVCAGVSALVINCMNSIEDLTDDKFSQECDSESGRIVFRMEGRFSDKSELLLKSLALGLENMEESYEKYIDVIFEEV